jgi:hypothetical protein
MPSARRPASYYCLLFLLPQLTSVVPKDIRGFHGVFHYTAETSQINSEVNSRSLVDDGSSIGLIWLGIRCRVFERKDIDAASTVSVEERVRGGFVGERGRSDVHRITFLPVSSLPA